MKIEKKLVCTESNAFDTYKIYVEEENGQIWWKAYRNDNKNSSVCVKRLDMCKKAVENLLNDSVIRNGGQYDY